MADHNIYISHAWGGESEKIVQEIYRKCSAEGLNIILDRKDLGYRESINSFMQKMGRADAIILVVSDKYLHSEYCMYELLQIYENKNILQRIFPVVLDEVSIAKSTERLDLVKYWENETENLEAKIRELKNLTYIEGITEDLNLYQKIRNNIANLTKILKDINTLNIRLHRDQDYNQLIHSIKNYLEDVSNLPHHRDQATDAAGGGSSESSAKPPGFDPSDAPAIGPASGRKKAWWQRVFVWLPGILLLLVTGVWFLTRDHASDQANSHFPDASSLTQPESNLALTTDSMRRYHQTPTGAMASEEPEAKQKQRILETDPGLSGPSEGQRNIAKVQPAPDSYAERTTVQTPTGSASSVGHNQLSREKPAESDLVAAVDITPVSLGTEEAIEEKNVRMEQVYVPEREIGVRIVEDISSNRVAEGDIIYLETLEPLGVQDYAIARRGARVRANVIIARPSLNGGRATLGIRLEALETVDGEWLSLNYHDIVDRRRGEIVFSSGTVFEKVEIQASTVNLKVIQ